MSDVEIMDDMVMLILPGAIQFLQIWKHQMDETMDDLLTDLLEHSHSRSSHLLVRVWLVVLDLDMFCFRHDLT